MRLKEAQNGQMEAKARLTNGFQRNYHFFVNFNFRGLGKNACRKHIKTMTDSLILIATFTNKLLAFAQSNIKRTDIVIPHEMFFTPTRN